MPQMKFGSLKHDNSLCYHMCLLSVSYQIIRKCMQSVLNGGDTGPLGIEILGMFKKMK